jgi:small subunit ribosomal protein S4
MRYTGSKWKINRREGYTVLGSTEKWKRRPTAPGQFPVAKKRGSEYAVQFREKQKVKRLYGMNETQFKRFYNLAVKSKGSTSMKLLQFLELRADNVLYRLGFANTRAQARQYITHGHIVLNGKKHNIPSTILKPGDEITLKDDLSENAQVKAVVGSTKKTTIPTWLEKLEKGGKVSGEPVRDDIDRTIRENLIIELYSR